MEIYRGGIRGRCGKMMIHYNFTECVWGPTKIESDHFYFYFQKNSELHTSCSNFVHSSLKEKEAKARKLRISIISFFQGFFFSLFANANPSCMAGLLHVLPPWHELVTWWRLIGSVRLTRVRLRK